MGELINFPLPNQMTPDQTEHWWEELEKAERRAEDIRRILGLLAVERGLEEQ